MISLGVSICEMELIEPVSRIRENGVRLATGKGSKNIRLHSDSCCTTAEPVK